MRLTISMSQLVRKLVCFTFCLLPLAAMQLVTVQRVQAQSPSAITYDKVMEYLLLEVSEAKLIRMVEASPTAFTLGTEQVQQLQAAGASDALIAAMQKKGQAVAPGSDITDFVLILDCSGSMNDQGPDGRTKWQAARQAALDLLNSIPNGRSVAVIVYGHDATLRCQSVETLRPLLPINDAGKTAFARTLFALTPAGNTPIAASLKLAGSELSVARGLSRVILITDGMETCHGDPAAEASYLVQKYPNLRGGVDVIGFCLSDNETALVRKIASFGRGKFHEAKDAQRLVETVKVIERSITVIEPVAEENLEGLSPFHRLLIEQLNDNDDQTRANAARLVGEQEVTAAVPALLRLIAAERIAPRRVFAAAGDERDEAIKALKILAPEKMATALALGFQSKSLRIRCWAAEAMARFEVKDAAPYADQRLLAEDVNLNAGLEDSEHDVLFKALKSVAPDRLQAALLQQMRSPNADLRAAAADKLGKL